MVELVDYLAIVRGFMPLPRSRRWLLLADLGAIVMAIIVTESGWKALQVGRSTLLAGAGIYLVATAALLFVFRRASPALPAAPAGASLLGRRGPAWLAYVPRLILGCILLVFAFRS